MLSREITRSDVGLGSHSDVGGWVRAERKVSGTEGGIQIVVTWE
jgi:hypothetical protein